MDNDFFWNTIEYAKTISNEEIQELIAKIIASEYNEPGTYSLSILQTLKMLGKSELNLLEKICSLCINKYQIPQNVFSLPENLKSVLDSINIDFGSLQILQSLGLFLPNDMNKKLENPDKKNLLVFYFDKQIIYKSSHDTNFKIIAPNFYEISNTGKQIVQHLKPTYLEEYFKWLKENYHIPNYTLVEN